jgi:hypothetical protein
MRNEAKKSVIYEHHFLVAVREMSEVLVLERGRKPDRYAFAGESKAYFKLLSTIAVLQKQRIGLLKIREIPMPYGANMKVTKQ